jgi:uncharacterized membrane protein
LLVLSDSELVLLLYPAGMNLALAGLFLVSLAKPPTIVERMTRLAGREPSARAEPYMRVVTAVWAGFFLINAGVSGTLAMFASTSVWALYNGLLAYIIIAVLFAGELLVRRLYQNERWVFRPKAR